MDAMFSAAHILAMLEGIQAAIGSVSGKSDRLEHTIAE
jgi:hypothetical protein